MTGVRLLRSGDLTAGDRGRLRRLFDVAWPDGDFTDDDWQHAMGGWHWLLELDDRIVSHASVVEREIDIGGERLRTGYLEAVATEPACRRRGFGSRVVGDASTFIGVTFALGALSTGSPAFYERLGWVRWLGPTYVRTAAGLLRTEEEDGGILVLVTPASPAIDLASPISCDWRAGDAW